MIIANQHWLTLPAGQTPGDERRREDQGNRIERNYRLEWHAPAITLSGSHLCPLFLYAWRQVKRTLPVIGDKCIQINQVCQSLRNMLSYARVNQSCIAMADEDDNVQVLEFDDIQDVLDV
jgi:hypothetical protein